MPRLTIYLARFIGLFLLIVSASMFLDPRLDHRDGDGADR